ncbi:hypothetical protein Xcel_1904 [Xylanimonas cellulosilytica DSM 15894]|uniref:Uncharacterized protein n=1 Tax=Xylanimonas cellulosilytica (strain DSM 15894 / JCM 12276 / CECT 5975 / KCTC 9989 / LMG 20990 / NBRC 107835 / XIL07) TaxID=446471 RepID=D1BT81_XYLCX|nr:hypothetical protein [Xylanimonas cellulosilytica]ACZ30923.1 hypothetical protein Xcel_1904 [Xylanimonas cellulosilytica DSM 15894]
MSADSPGPQGASDPREKFRHLDAPLAADQITTSQDVSPIPNEKDDRLRETEWLLRVASS